MSGDSVKPEEVAKVVTDGQSQAQKKKKKKNAPDRPQPAWLFPPDEENPVLNPKPVDEQRKRKDQEEREQAIKFLKHKSVTAPMKPAPPTKLLTLIGVFLSSYGFNSTCRIFTLERNARKKLDGWEDDIGGKLDKGTPDLVKIYKEWFKEWQERRELEMTSSDDDDDAVTKRAKMAKKKLKLEDDKANGAEDTSSSGSDSSSDDGEGKATEMNGVTTSKASKYKTKTTIMSSGSSSTSSSDSDADDEKGALAPKAPSMKSTVGSLVNKLKRKSSDSSSSASSSGSGSESDSDTSAPAKKKKKVDTVKKPAKAAGAPKMPMTTVPEQVSKVSVEAHKKSKKRIKSSTPEKPEPSSSSSDTSPSSSESDAPVAPKSKSQKSTSKLVPASKLPDQSNSADRKSSTDSSATLNGTTAKKVTSTTASTSGSSTSSSTSSASSSPAPTAVPLPVSSPAAVKSTHKKRKRSQSPDTKPKVAKKNNTPFSRIPQDVKIDEKLASNAYVPYDYAEKAHQDLIVTKGKGFTKEKNKKKRGAYKGGMIDVGGGKGIKFDE